MRSYSSQNVHLSCRHERSTTSANQLLCVPGVGIGDTERILLIQQVIETRLPEGGGDIKGEIDS